jgi:hypothetical protein
VIASYPQLQPDHAETSALLLAQLSKQLGNSSYIPPASEPFRVEHYAVRVNALWLLSLVMSLMVSLFCILFKQWIRSYLRWTVVTPVSVAVGVRQYRYDGLRSWKFETTLTMLPVLMQAALIVFFGGLLDFAWNMNRTIAVVVTVSAGGGVLILVATTILPILAPTSPYRTKATLLLRAFGKLVATIAKDLVHYAIAQLTTTPPRRVLSDIEFPKPMTAVSHITHTTYDRGQSDLSWMVSDVRHVQSLNGATEGTVRAILDVLGPSYDESEAISVLPRLLASGPPVQGPELYFECLWTIISALYSLSREEVQSILSESWPFEVSKFTRFFDRASPLMFLLLYRAFDTAVAWQTDWHTEMTLLLIMSQQQGDRFKRTLILLTRRRLRADDDQDDDYATERSLERSSHTKISFLEAMYDDAPAGVFCNQFVLLDVEGLGVTFDGTSPRLAGDRS